MLRKTTLATICSVAMVFSCAAIAADHDTVSDGYVKIGVLSDMSGVYKALEGPGAVIAAKMAIKDFGGSVLGKPVKVLSGDHQSKPDVGATLARRWIDVDGVDMIIGMNTSSVGLAVQKLASSKHTITMNTGSGTTALTENQCTKYGIHYVYSTHAAAVGTASAVVENGGKSWFFITADYAFGHSLQKNTTEVVKNLGGTVVGSVQVPLSTTDFASYLIQAQASGADVIGLANTGNDFVNAVKQANAFGIVQSGQQLVGLLAFITGIKSLGLDTAQGLQFTVAWYWNMDDEARQWSQRFFEEHGAMPTYVQAGVYSAVTSYLEAIRQAGTDDADAVRAALGGMTIDDMFVSGGRILPNGLMMHDMYLVKVKKPEQSQSPWDLMKVIATIPAEKAFIPLAKSACPLLQQ